MAIKTQKLVRIAFFVLIAVTAMLLVFKYAKFGEDMTYDESLKKIADIDKKYGMKIDDYQQGMDYLWLKPRFPNPLNAKDIPPVIEEFNDIRNDVAKDSPSFLLVDARIHLLEAERYYKISKKYALKGYVEDGFNCNDRDDIIYTVTNINSSVDHGRMAMENLNELQEKYKDEANTVDISRFWVKSVNKTFDELAAKAKKNERVINYFCLNESTEKDSQIEEEFKNAKKLIEEGKAQIIKR